MRKTIKQLQGESDYWRIKFINEQQRAEAAEAKLISVTESRDQWEANAHEFSRCADRLEAKLAELEKQEPAATVFRRGDAVSVCMIGVDLPDGYSDLYAHPVPAFNLADLVPGSIEPEQVPDILDSTANPDEYACCVGRDMWEACRVAMLRKIEEATK